MRKKGVNLIVFLFFSFALIVVSKDYSVADNSTSNFDKPVKRIVLNLNKASSSDFARIINAIAEIDLCHKITAYRITHRGFKSIEDLKNVEGMTERIYKKITKKVLLEI